jgi:hypothetical protein
MLNFIKIHPVAAEFFHADGRIDRIKLIVTLHNFANASKNPAAELYSNDLNNFYIRQKLSSCPLQIWWGFWLLKSAADSNRPTWFNN